MTDPATESFLRDHRRAYLFVRTEDGEARGWPLTAFFAPGRLWFTTYAKSAKMPFIHRASRASVAVLTDEGVEPVRYVVVEGPLSVRTADADTVNFAVNSRPAHLRLDAGHEQRYRHALETGKRVILEVAVERAAIHLAGGY